MASAAMATSAMPLELWHRSGSTWTRAVVTRDAQCQDEEEEELMRGQCIGTLRTDICRHRYA